MYFSLTGLHCHFVHFLLVYFQSELSERTVPLRPTSATAENKARHESNVRRLYTVVVQTMCGRFVVLSVRGLSQRALRRQRTLGTTTVT